MKWTKNHSPHPRHVTTMKKKTFFNDPTGLIPVMISLQDRDIILHKMLLPPKLYDRILNALPSGNNVFPEFTSKEIYSLGAFFASQADLATDKRIKRISEKLLNYLDKLTDLIHYYQPHWERLAEENQQKAYVKSLPNSVYQLHVSLNGIEPMIWRRLQVLGRVSLYRLNLIIQKSMGWTNSHLHLFNINDVLYEVKYANVEEIEGALDEKQFKLYQVIQQENLSFTYLYDYGDDWEHTVLVEKILPQDPEIKYPVCLDGRRACPPEDCGGPSRFPEFVEAVCNPYHEEHQDMIRWVGYKYDPMAFDKAAVNKRLAKMR